MTTTATDDAKIVRLPPVLDLKAADTLLRDLRRARGQPLAIDASQVQRLGGLCLQVLLCAQSTWESDEHALRITGSSSGLCENLKLFGADDLIDLGDAS